MIALLTNTVSAQKEAPQESIESVAQTMEKFVANKEIAGAVTLVADAKGIVHQHSVGFADLELHKAMKNDSIFWIASMSKPVTGVSVMILVDQGKVNLDSPISQYVPDMAQLKLENGEPAVITLRHLLTHTSGMAELDQANRYSSKTLSEAADKYAKVKVLFPPGTKWQYSQTSINLAARIVEVVSGVSFDKFVEESICKPLQMKDTGFYLSDEQYKRLAKSYKRTEQGELVEAPISLLDGKMPTDRDRFPAANGGLFSTAEDYSRFCRMLLNNGTLDGKRMLSEDAVKIFRTPAMNEDLVTGFTPGNTWGIGCCIVKNPQGVTSMLNPGSYGHGGAYGTQAWIDPTLGRCYILMVQRSNFANSDQSDVRRAFQQQAVLTLDSK
jgi:CubicO group peptidase (beta-lactamase class C family)